MKPGLAIWMPGGIGGGFHNQGLPFIDHLVIDLARNFEVDVYSMLPAGPTYQSQGFRFITAPRWLSIRLTRWLWIVLSFLPRRKKYKSLYAFWGYPTGFLCVVLGKLLGMSVVVHLLGADSVYLPAIRYGAARTRLTRLILRWTYTHASELITLTRYQASRVRELGVQREPRVIPFGVDLNLFKEQPKTGSDKPLHFLHVGNLTLVKDQFTLIRAFHRIGKERPSRLRILGVDHLAGAIRSLSEELGIADHVEFLSIQRHDSMPAHYAWADFLLHTSLYEAQCVAVVEAAACSTPIAGTAAGILADWGQTMAIVTPIGDSKALAEEVLRSLKDPENLKARTEAAMTWVKAHDRAWTTRQVVDTINSCHEANEEQ